VSIDAERAVLSRAVAAEAERDASRLVFVFENGSHSPERVTAGDLAVHGNQLAFEFRRRGMIRGDRMAIMLRNHPEFIYALTANAKLGLPTVPIDPRSRGDKLRYFLEFAECRGLVTADYVVADGAVADVIRKAGVQTWIVETPEGAAEGIDLPGEWPTVNEVLGSGPSEDVGESVDDLSEPWLLAYTSGTTGDPKAIEFTYERMVFYQLIPGLFGYRRTDVPYTGLSLTHGNALVATMMPAVWGAVDHSVFSRWFTRTRLWDICRDYGCTTWSNLGSIATAIYSERPSLRDRDHPVRRVISAGMPSEMWQPFQERFGVELLEWYGTMEGGFACNPPGAGPIGSFGKPPEGLLEMDVVDDEGRSVPPDGMGELLVRPAGGEARLSYFKNPEASARKVRNGWLYTGDIVRRDPEGWLYFAHRTEEGGLRKMGEFISEGFIRRVLAEDSEIADVHIYGVQSRSGAPGESDIVAALVVPDMERFDVPGLFHRLATRLERSHVPDFVQLVDELPRTASEKVQARFLAALFDEAAPGVHRRPARPPSGGSRTVV